MSAFTPSVRKQISSSVLFRVWLPSCILPFVFVIIISVTDEKSLLQYGYSFFPSQFGLDGFEFLAQFKDKILQALFISVFVTVVGTLTNVFITTTYAYAISRTTFKYRRFLPSSSFSVCCSTLVWYQVISWWPVYFSLVTLFGPWLFQCFSHHSISSWCVLFQEDHSRSHSRIGSYRWCQWGSDFLPNLFAIVTTRYRNHHAFDSSWFLEWLVQRPSLHQEW